MKEWLLKSRSHKLQTGTSCLVRGCSVLSAAGSGSVFISNIARELIGKPTELMTSEIGFVAAKANQSLHKLANQIEAEVGASSVVISPIEFDEACLVIRVGQEISGIVFGFKWFGYISEIAFVSHAPPSPKLNDFLKKQCYRLIRTQRDPMDIILSTSKKNEFIGLDSDLSSNFEYKLLNLIKKIKNFNAVDLPSLLVDYDTLLLNPLETIQSLAFNLGSDISPKKIQKIWQDRAFKQLNNAPDNHFVGGGSKKYEGKISSDIMDVLAKYSLECLSETKINNSIKYVQINSVNTEGYMDVLKQSIFTQPFDSLSDLKLNEKEYAHFNINGSVETCRCGELRVATNNAGLSKSIISALKKSAHLMDFQNLCKLPILADNLVD